MSIMHNINVRISKKVISDIVSFAKANYPKEFFAYLEGKIEKEHIEITNIAYHPFESTENSVMTTFHLGTNTQGFIGSVHSHPNGANTPSIQDIRSFSKDGGIHIIISKPFEIENLKCFDYLGKEIEFTVN